MDAGNPFRAPRAAIHEAPAPRADVWLPGFLASLFGAPLIFIAFWRMTPGQRVPSFLLDPGFVLSLLGCAAVTAWLLRALPGLHWSLHLLLAPFVTLAFLVALIVVLKTVA